MHGGITEDGKSVLVVDRPVGGEVKVYTKDAVKSSWNTASERYKGAII